MRPHQFILVLLAVVAFFLSLGALYFCVYILEFENTLLLRFLCCLLSFGELFLGILAWVFLIGISYRRKRKKHAKIARIKREKQTH